MIKIISYSAIRVKMRDIHVKKVMLKDVTQESRIKKNNGGAMLISKKGMKNVINKICRGISNVFLNIIINFYIY